MADLLVIWSLGKNQQRLLGRVTVDRENWFEARKIACVLYQVNPDEIDLVMVTNKVLTSSTYGKINGQTKGNIQVVAAQIRESQESARKRHRTKSEPKKKAKRTR